MVLLVAAVIGGQPAEPVSRIVVRDGRFIEAPTERPWRPRGFNYIRLRRLNEQGVLWHDTFNPATYDAARAEAALTEMGRAGFNAVRVFVDHTAGTGVAAPEGREGLSDAYIDNVADFLRRARTHGLRVVFALCWTPDNVRYRRMAYATPRLVEGENSPWFNAGYVRARATYLADFARAIRARDPALLASVLSLETENEVHMIATAPPFSQTTGTFAFRGKRYDLACEEDLQRLADDAAIATTNALVDAVRRVDRRLLVSANVFTFRAVGRSGPGKLRTDRTADPRFPVRPLALARSRIDYLSVHFYPMDAGSLEADFASIEMERLREACAKAGMPLIVGETGAFRSAWRTPADAVEAVRRTIPRLLEVGFQGWLYWTYDTDEQNLELWHARYAGAAIFEALKSLPPR
ncbi:MAG TPA: hypothetical protein VLH79_04900 [Chthonomonadales bacterium]|nr:hypothetical protein [Chthonomonadales bacterium]